MTSYNRQAFESKLPEYYYDWMQDAHRYFEVELVKYLSTIELNIPNIIDMYYEALFPGRRIRPILYLSFYKELTGEFPQTERVSISFAIEMFHAASIIIDDIVDKDEQRRNKVVFNKKYGSGVSSVFSHILVAEGYKLLSLRSHSGEFVDVWSRKYRTAGLGELADIYKFSNMTVDEQSKEALHKTISFFTALMQFLRLEIGPRVENDFDELGNILGSFFQISNDVSDLYTSHIVGRHIIGGSYRLNCSYTAPLLLKTGLLKEKELFSDISYERFLEISSGAIENFGEHADMIGPILNEMVLRVGELNLDIGIKNKSVAFLELLAKKEFWTHEHVKYSE